MKKVTKYQIEDGTLFDTLKTAKKAEAYYKDVKKVSESLIPRSFKDKGCDYANGEGYFQLTVGQIDAFFTAYRDIVKKYEPELLEMYDKNPKGIIGRYFSDSNSAAYQLYSLANRIDTNGRLWGQPYFALNPHEGKQIRLNK